MHEPAEAGHARHRHLLLSVRDAHFTVSLVVMSERGVPFVRPPDETVTLGVEDVRPWALLIYKGPEEA